MQPQTKVAPPTQRVPRPRMLFVPIPHNEREGFKAGSFSVGVELQHRETVSPIVSGIMIAAGAGLMVMGQRGRGSK